MMKLFGIWTVAVALAVSVVAAYYSIVGLTAIFAAAVIPVIIMGAVLELAKVTVAVWLHTFWDQAGFLMKTYLTSAVVVLMVITSMGIFGFLSKAHIEQAASSSSLVAQVERIDESILRQESIIERSEARIVGFDERVATSDESIQDKIEDQTRLIEGIERRLERDIQMQNDIINQEQGILGPLQDELTRLEERRTQLQQVQQANDVRALQALVGANVDGVLGPATRTAITEFQNDLDNRRTEVLDELERLQSTDNAVVQQARAEIQRLQTAANSEIQRAQDAINTFRDQLINVSTTDNTQAIAEQEEIIETARDEIDTLLENKYTIESELRQLAVEVGPVRYVAELIYEETNNESLEEAVRWVIILLVVVFDPLAIVMVLSGISILRWAQTQEEKQDKNVASPKSNAKPLQPEKVAPTVEPQETGSADSIATEKNWEEPLSESVPGFTGNDVQHRGKEGIVTVAGRKVKKQKPDEES
jgi:hypothetical protein